MNAIELIVAERNRQITEEGYSFKHDDRHKHGEIAMAAACYANPGRPSKSYGTPVGWPWSSADWKPDTRLRDLVKAGALIVAEIDRLQRRDSEG